MICVLCSSGAKSKQLFPGFADLGRLLLKQFKWGEGFFTLNEELLDAYSKCKDAAEGVVAQQTFLADCRNQEPTRGNALIGHADCSSKATPVGNFFTTCYVVYPRRFSSKHSNEQ